MEQIINAIAQWFYNLLFTVLMWFKDVFDMCYILVRKLAGIDTYYYNGQAMGTGAADSATVTGDIIEVLIRSDVVMNLFITLLVLGIILLIIVTFIAVWKTEWEFGKDGNSKSKVINAALKALFNFIAVPVITFFGIFVGNALLRAIDDATSGGENVKMSDIVLTSIATNALRADHQGETFNYELINLNNTVNAETGQVGLYQYFMNSKGEIVTSDILTAFKNNSTIKTSGIYYVDATGMGMDVLGVNQKLENGTLVFTFDDEQIVNVFFDKGKFNYVLGYLVLIIMLKTMLEITFGLVKRLFYMVFLFIVSPPIVAMAPVNDKSLPKWREAFIKNASSAFVTIGIYNIFLSIYPLFDRISLFGSSDRVLFGIFPLSLLNGFVSLLFVCVGLLVVNQISKAISEMFGVHDLYDQSTEKGKSLWGDAFGLAGKALKPGATMIGGAVGTVGQGVKFANNWAYKGIGAATGEAWGDIKGGTQKGLKKVAGAVNSGPLAEMWKSANIKNSKDMALGAFKANHSNREAWGIKATRKSVQQARKANKKELAEAKKALGVSLKGDKKGNKLAESLKNDEKLHKYREKQRIVEEYYKKKQQDKDYKMTKEERSAMGFLNAHKNFGYADKNQYDEKNAAIKASEKLNTLARTNNSTLALVKEANNFKQSEASKAQAEAAKQAIADQQAAKQVQEEALKEQSEKLNGIVTQASSLTKEQIKDSLDDIRKELKNVETSTMHSKDIDKMFKKVDQIWEKINKKK